MVRAYRFIALTALLPAVLSPCLRVGARAGDTLGLAPGRVLYKTLTWDDYRVDDDAPGMSAQTQTFIGYSYKARAEGSGKQFTATVISITFYGGMDQTRSWRRSSVRRDDSLLLQHEQGHLDINEVKARQLQMLGPADMPRGTGKDPKEALADLDRQMVRTYKSHVEEMQVVQRRYDEETAHGTRPEQQNAWSGRLRRALQSLPQRRSAPSPPPKPANVQAVKG
jgi:hypothetical protein